MHFITWSRKLLVAITLIFTGVIYHVQSQSLEQQIGQILEAKFPDNGPGAVFMATKEGEVIYKKAFGQANLELEVPMQTDHVFEIGSMTKQFTAVAILMLMEEGKLHLEDDITQYIPDYPTQGHTITIHHLLTHTSGIKNFTSVKGLNAIAKKDMEPLDMINFFKKRTYGFCPW